MKILIVDDERELVSILVEWLSCRGHEARGITGSADLQSWIRKTECELVLLDLMLPDGNGLDLIAGMVEKTHVSIVAMSGMDEGSWVPMALERGATDCLLKPISFVRLGQIIERVENQSA